MAATHIAYSSDGIFAETTKARAFNNNTNDQSISLKMSGTSNVYDDVTAMLWFVAPPILLSFGTFGNVMTIIVMRGMPSSQSTVCLYFYFTVLAVSDQCLLLTCLVFYWIDIGFSWSPSFPLVDFLCLLPKFVWNACGILSAWILVAMTFQRVTSVVSPHRVGILCTMKRGKLIVAIIVIFACAMQVEYLFAWVFWPQYRSCEYQKKYMYFTEVFEWMEFVVTSILPFVLLVAGNSVLAWQVITANQLSRTLRGSVGQQAKSGTEQVYSMTRTLIITSFVFLVATLPIDIFDIWLQMTYLNTSDEEDIAMINLVRTIVTILWISVAACNFYLYVLSGRKFREETAKYLCCCNRGPAK